MPRKPRFAPAGYFVHITQRGNYRQKTFFSAADYIAFQDLIRYHSEVYEVEVLSYCLMPNHVHLVARSNIEGGISRFMQGVAGKYAQYLHGRLSRRGRLWQERFYSSVLSTNHLIAAMRYVELNPVRSGLTACAQDFAWSSARVHCGVSDVTPAPSWLDQRTFGELFEVPQWVEFLAAGECRLERARIRQATQAGLPLGDSTFVAELEQRFEVKLQRHPVGRPTKKPAQSKQAHSDFKSAFASA